MRCFLTTKVERTNEIWREGFRDLHQQFGRQGVWFADEQLDVNDGFEGDITICLEIPEDVFEEYEVDDPIHDCRQALIPAEVLNKLGKPQVYDHWYAGLSREDLVQAANRLEQGDVTARQYAIDFRAAIQFFDEFSWQKPLKLTEKSLEAG